MRAFAPKVDVRASQLDEVKEHIRKNQFMYGVATGLVIAAVLSRAGKVNQTIKVVLPREIY
jgi:uncharacterized protein (DUF779 family)